MKADHQLQRAVLDQLDCDPLVNASHVGVAVRGGVVTLSGHVSSFGEKRAAETSAGRVGGVKAVVDQITLELPGIGQTADESIAESAYGCLASNSSIPHRHIRLTVESGVVTLRGEVPWPFQRQAAEDDLLKLPCVCGVRNEITIRSPVEAGRVHEKIHEALARIAPTEADAIKVKAEDGRVTLAGTVNSWHEKGLAESAAWSVPGVTEVVDQITVA